MPLVYYCMFHPQPFRQVSLGDVGEVIVMLLFSVGSFAQGYQAFAGTLGATMVFPVWVGNLKPNITKQEIENFLHGMAYSDFVVRMGVAGFPMQGAFCFVDFKDLVEANCLRHDLNGLSAQI